MKTYRIDPRSNGGDTFTVEAAGIEAAANKGAKQMFKTRASVHARRGTGDYGLSGMFTAYTPLRGSPGTFTSRGDAFHVRED